jgi:hypothetical protein
MKIIIRPKAGIIFVINSQTPWRIIIVAVIFIFNAEIYQLIPQQDRIIPTLRNVSVIRLEYS